MKYLNTLINNIIVPIAYPNETFVVSDKVKQISGLTDAPIDYKALKVNE